MFEKIWGRHVVAEGPGGHALLYIDRHLLHEGTTAAFGRLALDLLLLRRLGYVGAHVSGVLTPSLLWRVLDETARLDATLGYDWRDVWREAVGV